MKEVLDQINKEFPTITIESRDDIYSAGSSKTIRRWFYGVLLVLIVFLFLPWTQNIRTRGSITTLQQSQRPQELNTVIPGRILKWHVREGDRVKAGDTIVQIAEVKDDYLDPNLLLRTQEQLSAKELSVESYRSKAFMSEQQITALQQGRELKIAELQNKMLQQRQKIISDSMDVLAANNDYSIKAEQFKRQRAMYDSGLVSLTQLEQRNQALQDATAKRTSAEIKFSNAKQEYQRLILELNGEQQQYADKIAKAAGERFQSLSQVAGGDADIAKLKNQYNNYSIRTGLRYILAPQDGQIVQASKAGIGEIVKDGEKIVDIVPNRIDYAVELFVRPVDLPLVSIGQKVRFIFDGFPAIVFSGWPNASYGTFGGKVVAIESNVSPNGKFRILVGEDPKDKQWPPELKLGTGAYGLALLKDVPIWYELWRNINGFPPDYYQEGGEGGKADKKDKAKKEGK